MRTINKNAPHKVSSFDAGRLNTVQHTALLNIQSSDGSVKSLLNGTTEFSVGWLYFTIPYSSLQNFNFSLHNLINLPNNLYHGCYSYNCEERSNSFKVKAICLKKEGVNKWSKIIAGCLIYQE